ncbi:hypothetical protein [uncultured Lactobacillus sp.]|uniref:hypothetical protein n=1 Tax=uncultured Lactobacillus sp. TaxID=153152 RepID=UPI0023D6FD67|nr:hypothetical protein [uncultured Lactobacillus sp.]MDE7056125.1 hypothetical protein [Lactobacillus sp.]
MSRRNILKTSNIYKVIISGLSIIIIFLLFLNIYLVKPYNLSMTKLNNLKDERIALENKMSRKKKELDYQQTEKALSNPNLQIRLSAQQLIASEKAIKVSQKVFPILVTYDSSKKYRARKNKIALYVDEAVLNNKELFISDVDDDTNYITQAGLHSEYKKMAISTGNIDKSIIPFTVVLTYKVGFKGRRSAQVSDVYYGNFDFVRNKITTINRISNIDTGLANQ